LLQLLVLLLVRSRRHGNHLQAVLPALSDRNQLVAGGRRLPCRSAALVSEVPTLKFADYGLVLRRTLVRGSLMISERFVGLSRITFERQLFTFSVYDLATSTVQPDGGVQSHTFIHHKLVAENMKINYN